MAKQTKKKSATAKKRAPQKGFYAAESRGIRGVDRTQFHMLLAKDERDKLTRLTHKHKLSAADVVRMLIIEA